MLKRILIDGKIPHLAKLKKLLYWCAWFAPFSIFLMPHEFGEFAEYGWWMLTAVIAIRPLADLLPKVKLLRALTTLRREAGVFSGMLFIAHFAGFLIVNQVKPWVPFTQSYNWDLGGFMSWGLLGLLATLPLLLTSNMWSVRTLKRSWKRVQKLSYGLFFFGAMHIHFLGEAYGSLSAILVFALLLAAWAKKKFKK